MISLLSIEPSFLKLIYFNLPLRTFAPPARSTASLRVLDLFIVRGPGIFTLPAI